MLDYSLKHFLLSLIKFYQTPKEPSTCICSIEILEIQEFRSQCSSASQLTPCNRAAAGPPTSQGPSIHPHSLCYFSIHLWPGAVSPASAVLNNSWLLTAPWQPGAKGCRAYEKVCVWGGRLRSRVS